MQNVIIAPDGTRRSPLIINDPYSGKDFNVEPFLWEMHNQADTQTHGLNVYQSMLNRIGIGINEDCDEMEIREANTLVFFLQRLFASFYVPEPVPPRP